MYTFFSVRKYRLLSTLIACLAPLHVLAVSSADLVSEEELFGDIPVSHTATRLSQSVHDSPVSITIIDKEMIEAYDPQELVDVLRLVPGFQVVHPKGFRTSTSYLGLGDEYAARMQVQIDGRSVYSPILGHVEWTEIPVEVEDIDRIEVIRGPNAASYGANSFTAVINIITYHASDTPGTYIKATTGDRNTKRLLARHAGHSGKFDYRISASYRSDSGFDTIEFPDEKRYGSFNFRGDYQPNLNDSFEIQFGYRDSVHREGDLGDVLVNPERDVDGRTHFQLLRWRHQVNDSESFSLQFYHNYQRIDDKFQTDLIDNILFPGFASLVGVENQPVLLDFSRLQHRYDIEFQHNKNINDELRLVWGASARYEESGAAGFFARPSSHDLVTNYTYRLFAHGEWKPDPKWTINAGTMLENNDVTGTDISPRLAVNYHFTPNHTIRASVSRAYRTPSVFTLNADYAVGLIDPSGNQVKIDQIIIADRDLEPEKLTSFELAYIGHFPRYGINLDAKLFYNELDNIINDVFDHAYTDPVSTLLGLPQGQDTVFYYSNEGSAILKGFEAQLQYQVSPDTRLHAGYTLLNVSGKSLNEVNRDELGELIFLPLKDYAPKTITTLQLIHDLQPDIRASLAYHYYSEYEFEAGDPTGDFNILNARIAKKFRFANSEGQVSASFQNLRQDYFDFDKEQAYGKRIFLSFEFGFN